MTRMTQTFVAAALAAGTVWFNLNSCRAEIPSGTIVYPVSDPANVVWDVARIAEWKALRLNLAEVQTSLAVDVEFAQTAAGKLVGSGTSQIQLNCPWFLGVYSNAAYKVSGSITSSRGVAKLTYNASATANVYLLDKRAGLTVTATRSVTLNAPARQAKGNYVNRASASPRGKGHESGTLGLVWTDVQRSLGDGGWTLTLNLTNDTKTKLGGTATAALNSGALYPFAVVGAYTSSSDQSRLTLSTTPATSGSRLVVVLYGGKVHSISGKLSGQSIDYTSP